MDLAGLLESRNVVVADGAMGTELARHGLPAGTAPEVWNLDRPEAVEAVGRAYVEAGAEILLTNTLGGSRWKLAQAGLEKRAAEVNEQAARIARRAAGGRALVFASVGPTGDFLAPLGTRGEAEFVECFAEQIGGAVAGGVQGVAIETMTALEEALAALKAARQVSDVPVVVSLTFDRGSKGFATMMGVTPERAVAELEAAGADIVGSNCGNGTEGMVEVARLLGTASAKPLWIKPNAGMPELVDGATVFRETPEAMASRVPALVQAGARVIGGCCGTTPEHIRRIAEAVRRAAG